MRRRFGASRLIFLDKAEPIVGDRSQIPIWRQWLGDQSVKVIYVSPADPNKERIRALFPEATLLDVPAPK